MAESRSGRYEGELSALPDVIDGAREVSTALAEALGDLGRRPVRFVGSGGTLATAHLAADLHQASTNAPAWPMSPLLSIQMPRIDNAGFVLFSSSGKNPDAAASMAAARNRQDEPLVLITRRPESELPDRIRRHSPQVVTIPSPRDGFLATGSLIATSTALIAGHHHHLPPTRELVRERPAPAERRSRFLVLFGWGLESVARDIETRFSELGLAAVQIADYRNFAHGRHVGLSRNFDDTTVLALVDPDSSAIADRTLSALPAEVDVHVLRSEFAWPASALDLLLAAVRLPQLWDDRDPAKPKVPEFGRKLYNLPIAKILSKDPLTPIDRKRAASGAQSGACEDAFRTWRDYVSEQPVGALVLDYDGTCCTTADRLLPPAGEVQEEIIRIMRLGVTVAFASGRGKSLPLALREWMPEDLWESVLLGLYNGSVLLSLDEDVPEQTDVPETLASIGEEMRQAFAAPMSVTARSSQLTIESENGGYRGEEILRVVRAVLGRSAVPLKAYASGHSVDVIFQNMGKVAVLDALGQTGALEGEVLTIGDRGSLDGNDFEMLAATRMSLSVGSVSADLTRCWNLDIRGESGPVLLLRYLRSIRKTRSGVRFDWKYDG